MPNGLVFKCHLNTGQDAILFSYVLVRYLNGWSSTGAAKPLPGGQKSARQDIFKCPLNFFLN